MTVDFVALGADRAAARGLRLGLLLACLLLGGGLAGRASAGEDATSDSGDAAASGWKWHLAGVVMSPDLSEALFVTDGAARRLQQGEVIDGWTLAAIRPDDVTLEHDGTQKRLAVDQLPADDEAATASTPDDQNAPPLQSAQAVRAAARAQRRDEKVAESLLAAATKKMMAHRQVSLQRTTP